LIRYDHRAVRRAAAHLYPVRRQIGDKLPLVHSRVRNGVAHGEDPLPAETGEDRPDQHGTSFTTPRGNSFAMTSSIHLHESMVDIFQFVGQGESISTMEKP